MNRSFDKSRRIFLRQSTVLTSAAAATMAANMDRPATAATGRTSRKERLPREVWIATIAQDDLRASSPTQMIERMLARMEQASSMEPDIICLPEIFPFVNLEKRPPPVAEVAESGIGPFLGPVAKFAADHNCYVVCPLYTRHSDHCYNSAVFLDRAGELLGQYHKTYPTVTEIEAGVSPGPLNVPVFDTDFGRIAAQICFDIQWDTGWHALRAAGAEIVFWPSAFAGGTMINTRAWQNRYCVVSSTNKDVSKICDISGEEVASTSRWHNWVCAPVNLEKAFLHTWPYVNRFGDILSKYGSRIRIRTLAAEEWSVIELRDPELKIADIMTEFELLTIHEHLQKAEQYQNQNRPS